MSRRIPRVNQLIKKELSQILLKESDFPQNTLVTITRVETSPDLEQTRVYISVIPFSSRALQMLNKKNHSLQALLNKRLKMKKIPRIKFEEEKETARAARIEELLEKIHTK